VARRGAAPPFGRGAPVARHLRKLTTLELSDHDRKRLWRLVVRGRSLESAHHLAEQLGERRGLGAEEIQREKDILSTRCRDELDPIERELRAQLRPKYCAVCGDHSTSMSRSGLLVCDRHVASPANQARYDSRTGDALTGEYLVVPHWMWQMHMGSRPAHACETCGARTSRILYRGADRIGRFCERHAPGRPYHDPTACVACGAASSWVDRAGQCRCDTHHRRLVGDHRAD
jgi:hypothetical protein